MRGLGRLDCGLVIHSFRTRTIRKYIRAPAESADAVVDRFISCVERMQ